MKLRQAKKILTNEVNRQKFYRDKTFDKAYKRVNEETKHKVFIRFLFWINPR